MYSLSYVDWKVYLVVEDESEGIHYMSLVLEPGSTDSLGHCRSMQFTGPVHNDFGITLQLSKYVYQWIDPSLQE